jgi:site-specific DNA-methyltransferase (adenine-specific)
MKLIHSDCIAAMKEMPDNSVDSVVTDPPYELGFMGKSWDSSGIAFNVEVWQEALRVLKPGGHLIAFSGSRTYHRMAVAIEDAGFEIRDQIMWIYGSGFPKSHNISKGIDKAAGAEREVIGIVADASSSNTNSLGVFNSKYESTTASTNAAKQWDGWGTALKPAHEPMVLARKPLVGTVADNVLTYGVGGLNIDATRVGNEGGTKLADEDVAASQSTKTVTVFGNGLGGPFGKPIENLGRFPANVIHDGSWEVLELFPTNDKPSGIASGATRGKLGTQGRFGSATGKNMGESAFYGDTGSAARFFYCAKASKRDRNEGLDDSYAKQVDETRKVGSRGGNNPRNRGANERINHHPTVKPTALMQYLVRLVTPGGGIVLDPFMGSGSTGKAAMLEGFDFIGIEQEIDYLKIAQARIEHAVVAQMAGVEE